MTEPAPSLQTPDAESLAEPRVDPIVAEAIRRAHANGERWTTQRTLVVDVLLAANQHLSAEEVLSRALAVDSRMSQATVYRTLNLLVSLGIVERLLLGDGGAKFELAFGRQHHDHLIDADNGATIEFSDPEIENLQREIARRMGYDLIEHRLVLVGRKSRAEATMPDSSAQTPTTTAAE